MAKHTALRRGASVLVCLTFMLPVAVAAPLKSDTELGFYGISRQQFFATYKRVVMLPVELPPELGDRPDAQRGLEEAVGKYLRLANIDALASQRFAELADRHNHELGGIFDPRTGLRRDKVADQVMETTRKELEAAEHVDGFVRIRVRRGMAAMDGAKMHWDGVREASAGRPRKKTDDWRPVGTNADLAALSLRLEIFKTPDQVVFAADGGLQPVAYVRDIEGLGVTAVAPPSAELLKDQARFDRAARIVTLSLRYTPMQFVYFGNAPDDELERLDFNALPRLPEPRQNSIDSPLLRPRDEILKTVHRVALAPVEDRSFYALDKVKVRFKDRIRAELAPLAWELVDAPNVNELLSRKVFALQLFDPYTGKPNEAGFSEARKALFHSSELGPAPDAILWVRLAPTYTMQRNGDAYWDAVSQNAVTLGPVKNLATVRKLWNWSNSNSPGASSIKAASLEVLLTDASDATLYRARGGIHLAEKLDLKFPSRPDRVPRDVMFQDEARLDNAVHVALRDLVLTPEALATEVNGAGRSVPSK